MSKQITVKQVGQNIILNVDGTQYSKRIPEKEIRDIIKEDVKSYNKKNKASILNNILEVMTASVVKDETKPKEAAKKASKKEIKEAGIEQMSYNPPKTASTGRRGEY